MAVFQYRAIDLRDQSASLKGTLSADSPRQARDFLRQRGLMIEKLSLVKYDNVSRFRIRRNNHHKVTSFTRDLSTLLNVGTPLTESIETIANQNHGSFRTALLLLRDQVFAGNSLAAAMAKQPAIFDELSLNLVEVGEDSGTLDVALERLSKFRERREQFRGKIGAALLYPFFVLITAFAVSIFLMTYVIPSILQPLLDQDKPLPIPTLIVKGASDFLLNRGWLITLIGSALVVFWISMLRTKKGKWIWDSFVLRLPLIGTLVQKSALVSIIVVMETLLQGGVVFVRAIHIARKGTRNVVLKDALARCEAAVSAGGDIAPALEASEVFPPLLIQVFSIGQESGRLEEMLGKLAKDYDDQVALATQQLTAILEPVLILMLATIVATIALATMLPILEAGDVLN